MRKVTQSVSSAFIERKVKSVGNSVSTGSQYILHGNIIAEWRQQVLYITNAGWPSVTTRERLNALPGVSVTQRKHVQYLNGKPWDGKWTRMGTMAECQAADAERAAKWKAEYEAKHGAMEAA